MGIRRGMSPSAKIGGVISCKYIVLYHSSDHPELAEINPTGADFIMSETTESITDYKITQMCLVQVTHTLNVFAYLHCPSDSSDTRLHRRTLRARTERSSREYREERRAPACDLQIC